MIAPAEEPSGPRWFRSQALRIIVITYNPSDFPGKFVVRDHYCFKGFVKIDKTPRCIADTLQEARSAIPEELVCIARDDNDDPVIVESWL